MRATRLLFLIPLACLGSMPLAAQATISGGNCSPSSLSGAYGITLTGRALNSSDVFSASYQANGIATFDGVSKVTLTLTANSNLQQGKASAYSGTYTVPSNCYGTMNITSGASIPFSLTAWGTGSDFNIAGSDGTYVYTGTGSPQPNACVNASLSGAYGYTASGFMVSENTIQGTGDEAG